jgi:5-enolpyruvylshikimate-3-phosphate synthase
MPDDELIMFETANDHRLAMSLAVLSTYLKRQYPAKTFIIDDKKAV